MTLNFVFESFSSHSTSYAVFHITTEFLTFLRVDYEVTELENLLLVVLLFLGRPMYIYKKKLNK